MKKLFSLQVGSYRIDVKEQNMSYIADIYFIEHKTKRAHWKAATTDVTKDGVIGKAVTRHCSKIIEG